MGDTHEMSRTRTITWEDPMPAAKLGQSMSGFEYIQAVQTGKVPPPPIAVLLGMWIEDLSEGRVVFAVEPAEYHYNPIGMVHGGLAATLLDSALGCAIHSTLPAGTGYNTLQLNINYVRPLSTKTGVVYCEGKVIHSGGRVATAEGRLTDANGKLYAHATTTCIILKAS